MASADHTHYEATVASQDGVLRRVRFRWTPTGWAPWRGDTLVPVVILDWPTPTGGGRLPASGSHGIRCGDYETPRRAADAIARALHLGVVRRVEAAPGERTPRAKAPG